MPQLDLSTVVIFFFFPGEKLSLLMLRKIHRISAAREQRWKTATDVSPNVVSCRKGSTLQLPRDGKVHPSLAGLLRALESLGFTCYKANLGRH